MMGKINLLDLQTANLIAAGEVVERAASVVKELCENSIDAGAKNITVEIKRGGNAYIRVSDDGSGISDDDMPKTILRHATSKIKNGSDLEAIATLGFRGEALAAISSVAHLTIISKQPSAKIGSVLEANDIDGVVIKETGCPDGTTVIVRDLFYNVPARRKFMKKDSTEAMAVTSVTEKLALSHPDIAFRLISDGETKFTTPGDGKLLSAIYGVAGRAFASKLEEVNYELEGMRLEGFISRPEYTRGTRSAQTFFVNNRYIRSKTISAALEEAYKSYIPSGRFPAAVLFLHVNLRSVDVNVHPSKLEVRFSNEKNVFDTVYYGIRSVLENGFQKVQPEIAPKDPLNSNPWKHPNITTNVPPTQEIKPEETSNRRDSQIPFSDPSRLTQHTVLETTKDEEVPTFDADTHVEANFHETNAHDEAKIQSEAKVHDFKSQTEAVIESPEFAANNHDDPKLMPQTEPNYRLVGEIFSTYAVVELPEAVALIDKHAAHERIIYEKLRKSNKKYAQMLLDPIMLELSEEEARLLYENREYLETYGFVITKKNNSLYLEGIPEPLMQSASDLQSVIGIFVDELSKGGKIPVNVRADRALYTVACKAAIKAGKMLEKTQLDWIVRTVLTDQAIRYCPHGRPIIHMVEKRIIEKFFDR